MLMKYDLDACAIYKLYTCTCTYHASVVVVNYVCFSDLGVIPILCVCVCTLL